MSLRVKRDGSALWRGEKVGTIKKRPLSTRQGDHVFDWKPSRKGAHHALVAEHLADLKDRLTREFVRSERGK